MKGPTIIFLCIAVLVAIATRGRSYSDDIMNFERVEISEEPSPSPTVPYDVFIHLSDYPESTLEADLEASLAPSPEESVESEFLEISPDATIDLATDESALPTTIDADGIAFSESYPEATFFYVLTSRPIPIFELYHYSYGFS